jgi:hypothetical protein
MSGVDPECYPLAKHDDKRVCSACVSDPDLKALIALPNGQRGCSFCKRRDAPTAAFIEVATHVFERLSEFYSRAVDHLPYVGKEGGYQAWNVDTGELLREHVGLDLPRDKAGKLFDAIEESIGDELWCEYEWPSLEPDESLNSSWRTFCEIIKHKRRFFFHGIGDEEFAHPDDRSPARLLSELGEQIDALGLIVIEKAGYRLVRARASVNGETYSTAAELGPPPPEFALQSNRMNPPGISMFYGADNAQLALVETRSPNVSLGTFETTREIRILNLAEIPKAPGFFSSAKRMEIFTLRFLAKFADLIIQPVNRSDRTELDYIPTQVFTEFLRDAEFEGGPIDGVRYRSATGEKGRNVVLFATPQNVVDGLADPQFAIVQSRWLKLVSVEHRSNATLSG